MAEDIKPVAPANETKPVANTAPAKAEPQKKPVRSTATTTRKATTPAAPKPVLVKKSPDTNKKEQKKSDKKDDKKPKAPKVKMERDSFTMPKDEYAQLVVLKARLTAMGRPAKKSELLRAGIKLLAEMNDLILKATMAKIPVIKTGRPKKK